MSINTSIGTLTRDDRVRILKALTIRYTTNRGKSHSTINAYHIHDDEKTISIPYAYARNSLCLDAPARKEFRNVSIRFEADLRDYQKAIKKETISRINSSGCCVLSLYCGFGKTVFAIYMACKLRLPTLVLVNKVVLADQWRDRIQTTCPNATVQFLKPKDQPNMEADFYIVNAINIPKISAELLSGVGTLIVDELHLICAKTLHTAMLYLNPRYLIGLSATPYRPDGLDALINTYFGEFRLIKELNKAHTVYAIHTEFEIEFDYGMDGRIDWNSLLTSQSEHSERNQMIVDIVKHFRTRNFLILVKRISQGKILLEMLRECGEQATDLLGTKSTFDENARILVATSSKVGVGFSCDKLDTLVLASDLQEYFIQFLGRVFRRPDVEPIIFDIVDPHPSLKRHFASRKKVYKNVGGTVHRISPLDISNIKT